MLLKVSLISLLNVGEGGGAGKKKPSLIIVWNPVKPGEFWPQFIHYTVGLENFTTEKVHEYVFSTIVDSFHELNIHDWVV